MATMRMIRSPDCTLCCMDMLFERSRSLFFTFPVFFFPVVPPVRSRAPTLDAAVNRP